MQPLVKRANKLYNSITSDYEALNITAKLSELNKIDNQLLDPSVWDDNLKAQDLSRQSSILKAEVESWQKLKLGIEELLEFLALGDVSIVGEFEAQINEFEQNYELSHKDLLFTGTYDNRPVVLKLSSGVGGTDAQDWTEMIERMYLRWAEANNFSVELVERLTGDEAGIKNATYIINGTHAYGKLRGEHGVHRLVRLSPFNSDNLRQTSFALVEVLPEIGEADEVAIDEKDLKTDVFRSGGHGGQSVNTTDSAVRITHLPTSLVVSIQNERSQIQNKETALKILKGRLVQMQQEQHAEKLADLKANESASWGAQIRNYVLHPYTLVKDTRTKYEEKNVEKVLDGKIDGFINNYLEYSIEKDKK